MTTLATIMMTTWIHHLDSNHRLPKFQSSATLSQLDMMGMGVWGVPITHIQVISKWAKLMIKFNSCRRITSVTYGDLTSDYPIKYQVPRSWQDLQIFCQTKVDIISLWDGAPKGSQKALLSQIIYIYNLCSYYPKESQSVNIMGHMY